MTLKELYVERNMISSHILASVMFFVGVAMSMLHAENGMNFKAALIFAVVGFIGLNLLIFATVFAAWWFAHRPKLKTHQQEIIDNIRARGGRTIMLIGKDAGKTKTIHSNTLQK